MEKRTMGVRENHHAAGKGAHAQRNGASGNNTGSKIYVMSIYYTEQKAHLWIPSPYFEYNCHFQGSTFSTGSNRLWRQYTVTTVRIDRFHVRIPIETSILHVHTKVSGRQTSLCGHVFSSPFVGLHDSKASIRHWLATAKWIHLPNYMSLCVDTKAHTMQLKQWRYGKPTLHVS